VILSVSEQSSESLHGQISRQIRARILARELAGGELLPSIRALARECRVSIITVQRAYDDLEREGLLHSHPGKGFYVAEHPLKTTKSMAERRFAEAFTELARRGCDEGLQPAELRAAVDAVLAALGGGR
jgi:GntR family transcriptional regulator